MKKLLVFLLLTLGLPMSVMANVCANCKIQSFGSGPYYDELCGKPCVFISVKGEFTGDKPACATDTSWHFVLDKSMESADATMSILLSAYIADRAVAIAGNDTCSLYSAASDFRYQYLPW